MRRTLKGFADGPVLVTDTGYVYTLDELLRDFDGRMVFITVEEYKKEHCGKGVDE